MIENGQPVLEDWDPAPTADSGGSFRVSTVSGFTGDDQVRRLNLHLLVFVAAGRGSLMIDFVDHELVPGTLLLARPGQVRQLSATAGATLDAIAISFSAAFPARFPLPDTSVVDDIYGTLTWRLTGEDRDIIEHSFRELEREYRIAGERGPRVELLRLLMAALLLRIVLLSADTRTETPLLDAHYLAFRRELTRTFRTEHMASEYARRLGISARTLNRICLRASGYTAKQLIEARLVLEAQRLLAYTDLPVHAVADRLGFSEATNFVKFFARHAHRTPSEFRRSHR
ncbi:helix-turn-helix domain-containing protein [Nocardia sp. CDC159]|uniref:Helix-turn-helix domain-containing protein n=1 Tax=Nocardia pulmonis TaxID=2951408 RepID=A0A9X2E2S9_9NOCA|nr:MULTISPECIES: helix-turn-helix domain-containing protein [Nocardia]MCM6772596.1 helix-turn-helix domain-containing protein [Nocardia pulmonis]MCM6784746.1 helix-turn-helix domain-containing protein [Nocardia sp. CDC159]